MGDMARKADHGSNFYQNGETGKSFSINRPVSGNNASRFPPTRHTLIPCLERHAGP